MVRFTRLAQLLMTGALVASTLGAPATAPSTAASQPDLPRLLTLTRQGIVVREADGGTRLIPNTRDVETIADVASTDGVIATRGRDVLFVPLDGQPAKIALTNLKPVRFATLSPDRTRLACSSHDGNGWRVRVARYSEADGTFEQARPLTTDHSYSPTFAAEGTAVYFETETGLARADLKTGRVEPFLPEFKKAHSVRCARDGRHIAFSHERALYLHDLRDASTRKLTPGTTYDRFPTFAGDHLAFYREQPAGEGAHRETLVVMNLDGSGERVLVRGDVTLACFVQAD